MSCHWLASLPMPPWQLHRMSREFRDSEQPSILFTVRTNPSQNTTRDEPKYLTAPTSFAFASPSSKLTASGFSFCSSSLRKSHLSAVRTIFTPGQFSWISAIHLVDTFSKESRLSTYAASIKSPTTDKNQHTLKQSIMTWVSSYESARKRSNSSCPAVSHSDNSICVLSTKMS